MEKKIALVWAVIWGLVSILSIIALFWNPAHIATAVISVGMTVLFVYDYITSKNIK